MAMTRYLIIRERDCPTCAGRGWIYGGVEAAPDGGIIRSTDPCTCHNGRIRTEVDLREAVESLGLYITADGPWGTFKQPVKMEEQE